MTVDHEEIEMMHLLSQSLEANARKEASARRYIEPYCVIHGYGALLHDISKWWQEKSVAEGFTGTGPVIGPHIGCTVPCICREQEYAEDEDDPHCDWCCGCGWLTKKVHAIAKES